MKNPALFGKEVEAVATLIDKKFVISRVLHENNDLEIAYSRTHLQAGDKLFIIAAKQDMDAIIAFIGEKIEMHRSEWEKLDSKLVSKRIILPVRKSMEKCWLNFIYAEDSVSISPG